MAALERRADQAVTIVQTTRDLSTSFTNHGAGASPYAVSRMPFARLRRTAPSTRPVFLVLTTFSATLEP